MISGVRSVETPHGPARVTLHPVERPCGVLLLGHGAGGGFAAPDLRAATAAAGDAGLHVGLVEQPYRVAGRRAPAPAPQLDAAWLAVVAALRGELADLPIVAGGRSSGARVACRTATTTDAVGVLCLAFPVHPPGRPDKDRLTELVLPTVPVLVVAGERDPFGCPPPAPGRTVITVPGDHALRTAGPRIATAVAAWLPTVLGDGAP